MLMRRAKAYRSFCSQIALVYLQPFRGNSLLKCAAQPKIAEKPIKPLIFEVQNLSKSSMLIRLKSSSLGLVMIGSISMPICNHFQGRLANSGQITTFRWYHSMMPLHAGFLKPRRSRLRPLKFTFNAENFIHSLSWSFYSEFDAIHS